jgi:hypothetical protein
MANEVYVSAQGNTLQTNVLRRELEMLLYQKPFMRRLLAWRGSTFRAGTSTIKVGQIDYDDVAESVNEGSAVSGNTALTTGTYSLTPGRIAIKRVLSDLLAGIDSTGMMAEQALALYNFSAINKKMDALVGTALASLTGTAGTSGVAASVDDWYTALQTLRSRRVRGKKAWLGFPQQFNHLQSDMRGETGPLMNWAPVVAAASSTYGDDYLGTLGDIEVWTSDAIPTANAGVDSGGALMQIPADSPDGGAPSQGFYTGDAAIAIATGAPAPQTMGVQRIQGDGLIYTSVLGDVDKADTAMVTNAFFAVGVALAGRGIKFITLR